MIVAAPGRGPHRRERLTTFDEVAVCRRCRLRRGARVLHVDPDRVVSNVADDIKADAAVAARVVGILDAGFAVQVDPDAGAKAPLPGTPGARHERALVRRLAREEG